MYMRFVLLSGALASAPELGAGLALGAPPQPESAIATTRAMNGDPRRRYVLIKSPMHAERHALACVAVDIRRAGHPTAEPSASGLSGWLSNEGNALRRPCVREGFPPDETGRAGLP